MSEGVVRIATSVRDDPGAAARAVWSALRPEDIAGVMVFASSRRALEAMAAAALDLPVPVIGCTTAGEVTPWGARNGSVTAIGFPASDFAMQAVSFDGLQGFDPFAAHRTVAEMIGEGAVAETHLGPDRERAAMLLIDGLACREELITHTLRHLFGDIPTIGGSAADGTRFRETHLLHKGEVRSDRAVVALLSSRHPLRVFRSQHHGAGDKLAVVTQVDTAARRVIELNGEPAAQEYARLIGTPLPLNQSDFARQPLMVRVAGTYYARAPMRAEKDGAMLFHSAVERGLVLRLGRSSGLVDSLRAELAATGIPIGSVIAFESVHNRIEAEDRGLSPALADLYRDHRFAGFYGYGEQYRDLHLNRTLVGLAIGGRA